MKRNLLKVLLALALSLVIWLPGMALATVVNFDDLPTPNNSFGALWGVVPSSYAGFTWTGFDVQENNTFKSVYLNTGNFPSTPNAAFNALGGLTVTVDFGAKRDVHDAYFRSFSDGNASWSYQGQGSAATVTLKGYDGNTLLYTLPVTLSYTQMVDTPINFTGVTEVTFTSDHQGDFWLMDNMNTVNTVPLPPSVLLLGSGLAGLGFMRLRRRASLKA